MEKVCAYPRRRMITAVMCIFLCLAGAYNCLTHLFVYLDVEIFDLGMLIWDLLLFAGYVLMTVGAFKGNFVLTGASVSVIAVMKLTQIIKRLAIAEDVMVSDEIYTIMTVDVFEVLGLLSGALIVLFSIKPKEKLRSVMKKVWALPAVFFCVCVAGSLFYNVGVLSDKTVTMFFLGLVIVCFAVWCTDPAGAPRWVARRIRANEEAENNGL